MKIQGLLLITLVLLFASCDKVTNPIQNRSTTATDTVKYIRKVLLEDYTGHTCGNCPPAAAQAEALTEAYPDKVIAIAVHAGSFAKTKAGYTTSYTTTAGNDWNGSSGFNISEGAGNPNGLVNRKAYDGSNLIQGITKWPTSVDQALKDTYVLGFTLQPTYDAATRNLNTTVKAKFKTAYSSNTTITLVLTEDSIIGPQTDYSKNPDKIPDYVFMHMLRGDINGSWGTLLKAAPIAANDTVTVSFSNFAVNPAFKDKNLYVVAFVSDAITKEVLQAEKAKLIKSSGK